MKPMICQQCCDPMDHTKAKVEWLSTFYECSLVETIRVVHPECVYSMTRSRTMELLNLCDHWLPFWQLEQYIDIAKEKKWDNKDLALIFMKEYIQHKQQRLTYTNEVQHEDNKP